MSATASSLGYQRSVKSSTSISDMSVDHNYVAEFSQGMRTEVQQLYRPDDRSPWTESTPDETAADVEAGSFAQECALIVRREPHPITNQVALYSITIQSPLIKKVLSETFEGYEGLNTELKQLTFKAPFHPFYYRWTHFETLRARKTHDQKTQDHLNLLYPILKEEVMPHIETMKDYVQNGVITFDYLWTLFVPGILVYTQLGGQDRLMELTDSRYGANMGGEFFTMDCRYIDCNGADFSFGYVSHSVDISKFDGIRKLLHLDAFPGHLHPDIEGLVDRLHARGEKLEQLNGFHHMSYSGFYNSRSFQQIRKRYVENSRIIIDPHTFSMHGASGPGVGSIEVDLSMASENKELPAGIRSVLYEATSDAFQKYQDALMKYQSIKKNDSPADSKSLTPKQRLVCTPIIRGYCLAFKTWAEFNVENVHAIRWSEDAFPSLVLPHGYKEIIRAFVQEQLSRGDKFDDVVHGKGLGFIMLLSGDPGVGKTLTAESVAEEMRRPLYLIGASELGETPNEVEESLGQVLLLSSQWNAILLLDECDMFLEARTASDLRRNRLVSVFLRQLEYYRGVMFLTSNRVRDIDAAFESRIHLAIQYPPLDLPSRLQIWTTFAHMGDGDGADTRLNNRDLKKLAEFEMNGRQIKNIVKTARLLSKQEKAPLAMKHVEMVLKVKKISA